MFTKKTRKGITPVIAVVLLLMMTVGAAGAFYSYYSGMLDKFMGKATERQNTQFSISSLECGTGNTNNITVVFSNNGQTTLDLSPANIYVHQGDSEIYGLSKQGISLMSSSVTDNDNITTISTLDDDFSTTNSRAGYNIELDPDSTSDNDFQEYSSYTIEFQFPQIAGGRSKSATCSAESLD
ncbi:MAG: hypothetical protein MUP58_00075 [Candidatus Nanohaloarchaeota archaeon QJJ-9]|nr:hypothetical protein [Candidatus Nanohaloarchaeota archaeon QJJ-9]